MTDLELIERARELACLEWDDQNDPLNEPVFDVSVVNGCRCVTYSTRGMLEGNLKYYIAGNAPYIYDAENDELILCGTARSLEFYTHNFKTTGEPDPIFTEAVVIESISVGAMKVSAIQEIRDACDIGLAEAKKIVDDVLSGVERVLSARSVADATKLVIRLRSLGVSCRQEFMK